MPRKGPKLFSFRKPHLRMRKKGLRLSGGGVSIGGRHNRIDIPTE